jgi:DNA-binding XRE family transcriptional regulator
VNEKDIIKLLKMHRINSNYTQKTIAKMLKVSRPTLNYWENGRVPVTLPYLLKWVEVLGLKIKINIVLNDL